MTLRLVLVALALLASGTPAAAHTRSQSFSVWTINGETAAFSFTVDPRRVTQVAPYHPEEKSLTGLLGAHLQSTLLVETSGEPCRLVGLSIAGENMPMMTANGSFVCQQTISEARGEARIGAFFESSPSHVHLARLVAEGTSHETVLRRGRESFSLEASGAPREALGFISLGFHHVLSGLDHLLFLLALALAAPRLRIALLSVTGFTIGHMLTLGLAAAGAVAPDERLIEAIIGYTIAAAAIEAAAARGLRRKPAFLTLAVLTAASVIAPLAPPSLLVPGVALAVYAAASSRIADVVARKMIPVAAAIFGLAHGAGFAGGLIELELEPNRFWGPLLAFNIGVELAQLLALGIVFAGLALAQRTPINIRTVEHFILAVLTGVGLFWYASRLWA